MCAFHVLDRGVESVEFIHLWSCNYFNSVKQLIVGKCYVFYNICVKLLFIFEKMKAKIKRRNSTNGIDYLCWITSK